MGFAVGGSWSAVSHRAAADGRLTIGSDPAADPSTTGTTLYYRPYIGKQLSLYSGTAWQTRDLPATDINIDTTGLSADTNYDVWAYWTGSAIALELLAWTNGTTRATALVRQDGILCKTGDLTRRYLGTVRTNGSTEFEDSPSRRYIWNVHHRVRRILSRSTATASWTYTTNTWRQAEANTANKVEFVCGLEATVDALVSIYTGNPTNAVLRYVGIALDATNTSHATGGTGTAPSGIAAVSRADYAAAVTAGYHYLAWTENSQATDATTWYGTPTATLLGSTGLRGTIWS